VEGALGVRVPPGRRKSQIYEDIFCWAAGRLGGWEWLIEQF